MQPRFRPSQRKTETARGRRPSHLWLPKTPSDLKTGVPIIREIMVAATMSSLFVAFFALIASAKNPYAMNLWAKIYVKR
jgi:hypothetical protein